ncbi:MAG: DUF2269 family protein [Candidatus Eremiobacteraeota bacterium]|nr:DUF2269 family protein [Candidatus Eremiobacteraeota bacterium]
MLFLVLKAVPIVAVVAFFGHITVGVFWKLFADRTGDAKIMAFAMDGIIKADRVFTIPGVVTIVVAGVATALVGHYSILGTGWILWGLGLFIVSGIAFGPLARTQRAILAVAQTGMQTGEQRAEYEALSKKWNVYGNVALILPFIALIVMVLKPDLPAFGH